MRLTALFAIGVLTGCAGSQTHLRILEAENSLRVDVANSPDYDYTVSLRNVKDFNYNVDDKATRDATALRALQTQCPRGSIVGETVINTGTYLLGDPARTYVMQVRCNSG